MQVGLFSRKSLISIEEFCQDFYDRFFEKSQNIDTFQGFCDVAFDHVAEADCSFATVDHVLFRQEMTSLRMELFGLAWMHYFKAKHKQLEYCLREVSFTKKYLESTGQIEIWDIMQFYNLCIADSGIEYAPPEGERLEGRLRRAQYRAQVTFVNSMRSSLYDDLRKKTEYTPNCIARVLNRYLTDVAWKREVTPQLLASLFATRLGYAANLALEEVFFRLSIIIYGMYKGAIHDLKSVKVTL